MGHRFNRASLSGARGLDQGGATIVEILVALIVLGFMALICCKGCVSRASSRAPQAICMSKAKAIAMAVRGYASRWNGYAHPDPERYVEELGYLLKSQDGYDEKSARQTTAFACPMDGSPSLNRHGYPCSYKVAPSLVGRDISKIKNPRNAIIVAETELRHDLDDGMGATCVYADLHAELVTKLSPFAQE